MKMETLSPEQIKNWRRIIAMRLNSIEPGTGAFAFVMPESEVIEYFEKVKAILEHEVKPLPQQSIQASRSIKAKCNHSNTITGNCGAYCLDCESYI